MGGIRDVGLIEEVFGCDRCVADAYGFARPAPGRPYYKFPPTIGARGSAEILFVGINPRRSDSNAQLHREVMANLPAFELLAANKVSNRGRARGPYIRSMGGERHYGVHVRVVQAVYGARARFEDHAAVTELFLCASEDSTEIQRAVGQKRFPCADRFFARVVAQVSPTAIVAVGAPPARYLRALRIGDAGQSYCVRIEDRVAQVIELPHPNAHITAEARTAAFDLTVREIQRLRSAATNRDSAPNHRPTTGRELSSPSAAPIASKTPPSAARIPPRMPDARLDSVARSVEAEARGLRVKKGPPVQLPVAPKLPLKGAQRDAIASKKFTVRIPLTSKVRWSASRDEVNRQSLRRPLSGGARRWPDNPLARQWFTLTGILVWVLGLWPMNDFVNVALAGLLLWWLWALVVTHLTTRIRVAYLRRYLRVVAARAVTDETPSDYYRAWHGRPHGGEADESSHETFVAYPAEVAGRIAIQLLRFEPALLTATKTLSGRAIQRKPRDPKVITVEAKGRGFEVTIVEQQSLSADADVAQVAELKASMDEEAENREAEARSCWQAAQERTRAGARDNRLAAEAARDRAAEAQSTVEALKHWRH